MIQEFQSASADETLETFLKEKGYVKVLMSLNSIGHFELDADVNNTKGKFILDTGASGTVINEADIEKFALRTITEHDEKAAGLGTTTLDVLKSNGNDITLGEFEMHERELGVINLEHVNQALINKGSSSVNGVIGADIMKNFDAVIDYKQNALYLKKSA